MKRFNEDKSLKKQRFKKKLCIFTFILAIFGIFFLYLNTYDFDDNSMDNATRAYVDGEYSKTIPGKNDGYVVEKVVCDNGTVGEWDSDKWGLFTTNMTQKSRCNIYFETIKTYLIDTIEEKSNDANTFANDDPDNNIRYIGANPNNYVYFNCSDYNNQSDSTCEKWRIIGIFNNVAKSDGTKENLIKIIKDESIADTAWDSNNVNDWSTASLQQNLNGGAYYNTTLKNDATRNAIESVIWNLGGISSATALKKALTKNFYEYENGDNVYSTHATTWTGKIALMYPSDYGYATAGGSTTKRLTCLSTALFSWSGSTYSDCKDNNYLFNGDFQWLLAPYSATDDASLVLSDSGYVIFNTSYTLYTVRPVLYFKSNVTVKSGDGSSNSPYQLGIK